MAKQNIHFRWLMLFLMLLAFTVTFMSRFVWSPLNATVAPLLGMSKVASGSFMSAFFIGYVITQIPGGILADRIGVKYVLAVGVFITGITTVCMSFISSYSAGFGIRVITGLGAGVVMACCSKVIGEYFKKEERGVAFGIFFVGSTLGLLLANKIGAALMIAYSWHTSFRVVGYIAIIIAAFVLIMVKNIKSEVSDDNKNNITLFSVLKVFFTTRNLIGIGFAGFFYMFLNLGISTWANSYMKSSIGFNTEMAASVMSFFSMGGIVGTLLTGFIVSKLRLNTRNYLIGVFAVITVITVIFGYQTNLSAMKIIATVFGFVMFLPNAHLNSLTLKYAPNYLAASVMGIQNFIFQMASIFSPLVVGWTVDITGAFRVCWWTLAAAPIVGLLFLFMINEREEAKIINNGDKQL
jgi:sugar phosphate permease